MSTSIRGGHKIFKEVFQTMPDFENLPNKEASSKRGRNIELNNKRNECLIERYFYYGHTTQDRYEVIIEKLSREFFLSSVTVPKVIDSNYELLTSIKREFKEMSVEKLRKRLAAKWPHLLW